MQIEIKSHGLAALWRDLLANSDVTSTVAAGAAALAISYVVWKIGRGIGQVRRNPRAETKTPKPVRAAVVAPSRVTAPVVPARSAAAQWQRLEGSVSGHLDKADSIRKAHDRAGLLTDSLDLEIADLLTDLAGVSTYAAARRTTQPSDAPLRLRPALRHPLAA